MNQVNQVLFGDCRDSMRTLARLGQQVQMCVTSPPYYQARDYGHAQQIGHETTFQDYVTTLVDVFECVRELLTDDGTLWLNLGDRYNNKDLMGIPWRVAFALQDRGWYLRSDIIWHKPNCMPESIRDRPTHAHEYLFLLTKSRRYYYDADAIKEAARSHLQNKRYQGNVSRDRSDEMWMKHSHPTNPHLGFKHMDTRNGRNRRSVWNIPTVPYPEAHFATFPPDLITPCILAGSRPGEVVLDPFLGSGTTAEVAEEHGRQWIGCELVENYHKLIEKRIRTLQPALPMPVKPVDERAGCNPGITDRQLRSDPTVEKWIQLEFDLWRHSVTR